MVLEIITPENDSQMQPFTCEPSASASTDLTLQETDNAMNSDQVINEAVWEMLANFEDEMHQDWLDSIMHELEN